MVDYAEMNQLLFEGKHKVVDDTPMGGSDAGPGADPAAAE